MTKNNYQTILIALIILAGIFFLPWRLITWGKIETLPTSTILVTGEAKTQEKTQIATFYVGVSANNDNKDEALNEVNTKINEIISSVKNFGIPEKDVQTQNASVYQREKAFIESPETPKEAQWYANNSISITLRDVEQAEALAAILNQSGATSVNGPSYSMDDTTQFNDNLLKLAVENAREKATTMAETDGQKLGKIISITEGGSSTNIVPLYRAAVAEGGGDMADYEPGSQTVQKSVTVVFEMK